jgi:hypothetical protein
MRMRQTGCPGLRRWHWSPAWSTGPPSPSPGPGPAEPASPANTASTASPMPIDRSRRVVRALAATEDPAAVVIHQGCVGVGAACINAKCDHDGSSRRRQQVSCRAQNLQTEPTLLAAQARPKTDECREGLVRLKDAVVVQANADFIQRQQGAQGTLALERPAHQRSRADCRAHAPALLVRRLFGPAAQRLASAPKASTPALSRRYDCRASPAPGALALAARGPGRWSPRRQWPARRRQGAPPSGRLAASPPGHRRCWHAGRCLQHPGW